MKLIKGSHRRNAVLKLIHWLHLWPSLVASLVLIVVCLTGAIVVFADEVIDFNNREVLYVNQVKTERLPMEVLLQNYAKAFPDQPTPSYLVTYKNPKRTVKFNHFDPVNGLQLIYMDPYTGEILKKDGTIHFFFVTAHLHASLLLGEIGKWIVDISTLIFVLGLLTGIVLWFPKKWNKSSRKIAFKINWKAKFKRLNYSLHNVLGFYALSICFVLGVSGVLLAYPNWSDASMKLFGGQTHEVWESSLPEFNSTQTIAPMNPVFEHFYDQDNGVEAIQVYTYALAEQGYYILNAASWVGLKNYIGKPHFINKYTGKEIAVPHSAHVHEKFENAVMMLHMGSWLGLWGKIISFLASLIATSLPITGFLYWWGRLKKNRR